MMAGTLTTLIVGRPLRLLETRRLMEVLRYTKGQRPSCWMEHTYVGVRVGVEAAEEQRVRLVHGSAGVGIDI